MKTPWILVAPLALLFACPTPTNNPTSRPVTTRESNADASETWLPSQIGMTSEATEIDRLEDLRDDGNGRLQMLARDARPEVKGRALLALGRLRSPSVIPALVEALSDKNANVRKVAAFAAGLLGDKATSTLEDGLQANLLREDVPFVRRELLLALARIGKENTAPTLIAGLAERETKATAALAIGLYAQRGQKLSDGLEQVLDPLLDHEDVLVRYGAAFAFMRAKRVTTHMMARAQLETDAETRALLARAAGGATPTQELSATQISGTLLLLATEDQDWRVRVEALRGLAKGGPDRLPFLDSAVLRNFTQTLKTSNGTAGPLMHPVLAGLEALEGSIKGLPPETPPTTLNGVKEIYQKTAPQNDTEAASQIGLDEANCRAALILDLIDAKGPNRVKSCGSGKTNLWRREVLTAQLWRELGKKDKAIAEKGLRELLKSPLALVRAEAIDALGTLPEDTAQDALRAALDDQNIAVASTAVERIASRAKAEKPILDKEAVAPLIKLLYRLTAPADAESIAGIYSALAVLGDPASTEIYMALQSGLSDSNAAIKNAAEEAKSKIYASTPMPQLKVKTVMLTASPAKGPKAGEPVNVPAKGTKLKVETTKGELTFELLVEDAPRTCANFADLAKSGYFDGLVFHRVVSDFVIQGGDPEGTGWGGPGWAIRDELSPVQYQKGAVGLALGGPDTGGSQWFVMHTYQPHLDTRYPLWGKLTAGQEIVDSIQVGDVIKKVTVVAP
jgi:cyclophilin family peptidyl-prolyl cis-trans isomerase/HEAT repeat protein